MPSGLDDDGGRISAMSPDSDQFVMEIIHMAKRTPADQTLRKVLGASDQRLKKHSSLYDWMFEHHDALKAEFAKNGPQWSVRVKAMGEAGLTDRTGKPASERVARNTWYSVCRAIEGRKPKRATAEPTAFQPAVQTPPKAAQPSATGSGDDDDEEEIEITMGDGTPRKIKVPKQR